MSAPPNMIVARALKISIIGVSVIQRSKLPCFQMIRRSWERATKAPTTTKAAHVTAWLTH